MQNQPKYKVTWNNGYWKVFDMHYYGDAGIFYLQKDAVSKCNWLNSKYESKAK